MDENRSIWMKVCKIAKGMIIYNIFGIEIEIERFPPTAILDPHL